MENSKIFISTTDFQLICDLPLALTPSTLIHVISFHALQNNDYIVYSQLLSQFHIR